MSGMQKALGGNVAGGRFAAGTMGSMGLGLGLGVLGTGMQAGRGMMDNPNSGLGKTLGVLGTTAQYAGMGAMLGPYGALAGLGLGLGVGLYNELSTDNKTDTSGGGVNTGVDISDLNLTRMNDGIVFHPQDKFMQVGGNAMLASTQKGQLDKAANKLTGGGSSGNISHKFEDLKIKVEISAPTDEKVWREIFNSPEIMRRLTQEIHIATESAVAGGKVTGSGPKRRGKK